MNIPLSNKTNSGIIQETYVSISISLRSNFSSCTSKGYIMAKLSCSTTLIQNSIFHSVCDIIKFGFIHTTNILPL